MDLSFPLTTIAPTLDAGVLQVLAATTAGCTAAEVHRRLARGSDEGVRRVLTRLVRQGVVLVETPARYPVYNLNREHLAVPHIERLTRVRGELLDRISSEVADWAVEPIHVGMFGSFARGSADSDSDIDVLLVRPEPLAQIDEGAWLDQLDRLDRHIRAWTGNAAQIIDLTPATLGQMARDADPLVDSWRADDIPVHGERLLDLLRRLR
ncbi:nucleotidyltransferase domain-containing protein [Knoellia locipacati]|uniref:nucleotidyltransferase domain-containing protein n=1 Tax=Knoellia locipacati TaxID=882824 RepID=UPI00384F6A32